MLPAVFRLWGHALSGPRVVRDQSIERIIAPVFPPPERKSSSHSWIFFLFIRTEPPPPERRKIKPQVSRPFTRLAGMPKTAQESFTISKKH
jgi:hypothetical protein